MPLFKTFSVKCNDIFPSKIINITINPSVYIVKEKNVIRKLEERKEIDFSISMHGKLFDKKFFPLKISIVDIISRSCVVKYLEYTFSEEDFNKVIEVWRTCINDSKKVFLLIYSNKDLLNPLRIIRLNKEYFGKDIHFLVKMMERGETIGEIIGSA